MPRYKAKSLLPNRFGKLTFTGPFGTRQILRKPECKPGYQMRL
jgi:hypothetical protein